MNPATPAATESGRLWIVAPVFYDSEPFRRLRTEILTSLAGTRWASVPTSFVVVDDSAGADPETRALAQEPDTQVLFPPFNLGHQRAIVYGLRALAPALNDHDHVVTMDSDGEDKPEHVPLLLAESVSSADDLRLVVLAKRTTRDESLRFRLLYTCFRVLFRVLTGVHIATGNFAAHRGLFVKQMIFHPSFDLCYSTSLLALRGRRNLVPCARGTRFAGKSKMNTFGLIAHGIRMMLPFAEGVAVRLLTISAISLSCVGACAVATGLLWSLTSVSLVPIVVLMALATLVGTVTFVGFLTLFSGFAQSSAIALQGIDTAPSIERPR